MVEKPRPEDAPSNLAVVGRYILTPDIMPVLEHTAEDARGEIQLTDAIAKLLAKDNRPVRYSLKGSVTIAGQNSVFCKRRWDTR